MDKNEHFNEAFIQLVIGLQSTAWIALGKVENPRTKKIEKNLPLARESIDTLLMLKEKTKGNLNETEKGILEQPLQQLELKYIEEIKKA